MSDLQSTSNDVDDFQKQSNIANQHFARIAETGLVFFILYLIAYVVHILLFFWILVALIVYKDEISKDMFYTALILYIVGIVGGFLGIPSAFFIASICLIYRGKSKRVTKKKYRVRKKKKKTNKVKRST